MLAAISSAERTKRTHKGVIIALIFHRKRERVGPPYSCGETGASHYKNT